MGTVNASSYMEKQEIAIVDIWFGIERDSALAIQWTLLKSRRELGHVFNF